MALDVGTVTLTFYLILDFVFTSLISPVGNKCSEAFLDIALKNSQLMLIVTDEKFKSCTHFIPSRYLSRLSPAPTVRFPCDHKFFGRELRNESLFLKIPKAFKI